jgi:Putative lumazine-binding
MLKRTFIGLSIALTLTAGLASAQRARAPGILAQSPLQAVTNYTVALENGDGKSLSAAFHPQALLHTIQGNTPGRITIRSFASGVSLGGLFQGRRSRTPDVASMIKFIDADTNAGVVRLDLDPTPNGVIDYLMVARIGPEWKIISKVFEAPSAPANADLTAARRPVEAFLASRSNWNMTQFSGSIYSTAQIFTVANDQLSAATVPQTLAEYGQAQSVYRSPETNGVIDTIETLGTTGYARFHATTTEGTRVNRAAFLLKNNTEWRIISLYTWTVAASASLAIP